MKIIKYIVAGIVLAVFTPVIYVGCKLGIWPYPPIYREDGTVEYYH